MEPAADMEQELRQENRKIRRRLLGAVVIFAATVMLWRSGDVPPPPEFYDVPTMPDELVLSSEGREVTEIINEYVDEVPVMPESLDGQDDPDAPQVAVISADEEIKLIEADDSAAEEKEETAVEEKQEAAPKKETKTAAASAQASTKKLQAGSFRNKDNLTALEKRLRDAGYATAASEQNGLHRLQIVGLADDIAVVAAKEELSKILKSMSGGKKQSAAKEKTASSEKPAKTAKKETPSLNRAHPVAVQIGAFRRRDKAESIVGDLRKQGFEAWLEPTTRENVTLLRVRVGAKDRAAAEEARRKLVKMGYETARVIDLL